MDVSDASLGERLRAAREAKGLTLQEAEKATRIRARFLAALEAEDFAALPSLTQARGFIRNYAQFLGLDADEWLTAYPSPYKPNSLPEPRPAPPPMPRPRTDAQTGPSAAIPKPSVRARLTRIFSADLLIAVIVTLLIGALLVWGGLQLINTMSQTGTGTPPSTGLAGTPDATGQAATPMIATVTEPPATATPAPLPTARPNYVGVNIVVLAEQRLWLRALVDGAETFVGQLPPGASREFVGQQAVELWTGNGQGMRVVFNGQDQGTFGEFGDVAIRIWTLNGMVTPTPTTAP